MIWFLFLITILSHAQVKVTDKLVNSLATELEEDMVLYRWGSKDSADNLVRAGSYTEELREHFGKKRGEKMGPGIYGAESIYSSSTYRPTDGRMIEVRIPKGTRVLDLYGDAVEEKMKKLRLDPLDVYGYILRRGADFQPQMAIKYDEDWWVVKAQNGVKFSEFDPGRLSAKQLMEQTSKISDRMTRQTIIDRIRETPNPARELFNLTPQGLLSRGFRTREELEELEWHGQIFRHKWAEINLDDLKRALLRIDDPDLAKRFVDKMLMPTTYAHFVQLRNYAIQNVRLKAPYLARELLNHYDYNVEKMKQVMDSALPENRLEIAKGLVAHLRPKTDSQNALLAEAKKILNISPPEPTPNKPSQTACVLNGLKSLFGKP